MSVKICRSDCTEQRTLKNPADSIGSLKGGLVYLPDFFIPERARIRLMGATGEASLS